VEVRVDVQLDPKIQAWGRNYPAFVDAILSGVAVESGRSLITGWSRTDGEQASSLETRTLIRSGRDFAMEPVKLNAPSTADRKKERGRLFQGGAHSLRDTGLLFTLERWRLRNDRSGILGALSGLFSSTAIEWTLLPPREREDVVEWLALRGYKIIGLPALLKGVRPSLYVQALAAGLYSQWEAAGFAAAPSPAALRW